MYSRNGYFQDVVDQISTVKIEGPFEADALRILRDTPGISVIGRERKPSGNHKPDATVRFAGTRANITVEVKRRVNAATAWHLVQKATEYPDAPLLVIAGETTAEARQILQNHGVALVDGLRNAHIALPGLFFHIEGHLPLRRVKSEGLPTRLSGKAAVAVQALLLNPNRAWQIHEVAKEARISPGLAHRVLARLQVEGIVAAEGSGPNRVRRVTNPTALLDLYAEENGAVPHSDDWRYGLAQTPQELIKRLATNLGRDRHRVRAHWCRGGELWSPRSSRQFRSLRSGSLRERRARNYTTALRLIRYRREPTSSCCKRREMRRSRFARGQRTFGW